MTTDASAPAARRPGEQALAALGLGAPALDPADASPHTFPGGGRWRTEIPSCEGPEALAVVLEEAGRLDVPIHRISQGSGIWMLTDSEITEMVKATGERDVELCLFTGPRGTWDIGASARTDSGGAGLRARGHDAVAGFVSKTPSGQPSWACSASSSPTRACCGRCTGRGSPASSRPTPH